MQVQSGNLNDFQRFLKAATKNWEQGVSIKRFSLGTGDVSCVLWDGQFYMSGTDIVKAVVGRLQFLGRHVVLIKKFEEGVFSDLRNLKAGRFS
jgi:transcription factor STE12